MKKYLIAGCAALSVTAMIAPTMAEAQPRKRPQSMQTNGAKKGSSTYKPSKSPQVRSRSPKKKPSRKHGVNPTASQMRKSAELAARRGSKASSFLSRVQEGPLNPKIDTRRMSMDVNTSGGRALSKPIAAPAPPVGNPPPVPPRPGARGQQPRNQTGRQRSRPIADIPPQPLPRTMEAARNNALNTASQVKPVKVRVVNMAVNPATAQRSILVGDKRARTHGTRGLTFNRKDEFQSVGGRVKTAINGRGTGIVDRVVREYKTLRGTYKE